jgi:hypothetical protein
MSYYFSIIVMYFLLTGPVDKNDKSFKSSLDVCRSITGIAVLGSGLVSMVSSSGILVIFGVFRGFVVSFNKKIALKNHLVITFISY